MIAWRIHQTFEFGKHSFDFTWQSLRYIHPFLRRSSLVQLTSHVNDNRLTAMLLKPITMAKNALRSRNSLQLIVRKREREKWAWRRSSIDLLRSEFDEFPQELNSFAGTRGQTDLGHYPILNLVESSHEQIEIRSDFAVFISTEDLIEKFMLDNPRHSLRRSASRLIYLIDGHEQFVVLHGNGIGQFLWSEHF